MTIRKHEPQPLPLHIAERWNFELTYVEDNGTYLYCLTDWLIGMGVTSKKVRRDAINRVFEGVTVNEHPLVELPVETNGGTQQMKFSDDEMLYRISQELKSTKTRKQLKEIKDYLAKAGVLVDKLRQASQQHQNRKEQLWDKLGHTNDWKQARRDGTVSRKRFTSMLQDAIHEISGIQYGQATNAVYSGLFDRKANELKQQAGVKQIRDHMPTAGLSYVQLVEDYVISALQGREDVPFDEALALIKEISTDLKPIITKHQRLKGIDLGTGRPLLPD